MLKIPTRRTMVIGGNNDLFRDNFRGSTIDTRWTETDTENKLSVSGGELVFAGGLAVPAWGDPRVVYVGPFARHAGLTAEFRFRVADANASWIAGFAASATPTDTLNGIRQSAALIQTELADSAIGGSLAAATGVNYIGRIVNLATGFLVYLSNDGGVTYSLSWVDATDTTDPVYIAISNYNAQPIFKEARWFYGSAKPPIYSATPTAPTPSLGAEILTDPGLEANYTAGLCDSLALENGAPTLAQSADVHGGSKAQEFTATDASDRIGRTVSVTGGLWHQATQWAKRTAGASGNTRMNVNDGTNEVVLPITSAAYAQQLAIMRPGGDTMYVRGARQNNGPFDTVLLDDQSLKSMTLASTLTLVADAGQKSAIVDSHPTLTTMTQCGHAMWVDSATTPLYGLWAYHDGTNSHLDKLVNGTWTSLISAAATYEAGAQLRTIAIGTSVWLYYNGAIVGTVQTVSDAGFGTKACAFSTLSTNAPGAVEVNV